MPSCVGIEEALRDTDVRFTAAWSMAAPALNLFGGFQDHLGPTNDELLGQRPQGAMFGGADFGLHGFSQEHKELFRQYSQQVEQEREAQARMQHAFEAAAASSSSGTPTHAGLMGQSQGLSSAPQASQQASSQAAFTHTSASVPHTPLKPFDSALAGLGTSALSTPNISAGTISLPTPAMNTEGASSALHSGSPMTPRQLVSPGEHMLLMPPASLLTVHTPSPGQMPQGHPHGPPPPPPSTPNSLVGIGSGGSGPSNGSRDGNNATQGQLTIVFANALAQAAVERGVDPGTLVQLLQSPKLVDVLLSKAGDLQQQQQQQQQGNQMQTHAPRAPPPPPPPKSSQLQSRLSAPVPGEWSHHHSSPLLSSSSIPHFRPPPPPPPRPSHAATPPANYGHGSSAGGAGSSSGVGSAGSSGSLDNLPSMQHMLSSGFLQEFVSARNVLVQVMMSAYNFLNSESMHDFYDKLHPISKLYDEMHELPVVQKRKRCLEMSYLRLQLMQDPAFVQILQAVCALRHHLHSLSRKVLLMNQG
ncbi:hypothetical protein Agub_g10533, partial [Astrephomene gubernaculifera]